MKYIWDFLSKTGSHSITRLSLNLSSPYLCLPKSLDYSSVPPCSVNRNCFYTGADKILQLDGLSNSPMRKNRENIPVKDNFELEVLQMQYNELKEKVCNL